MDTEIARREFNAAIAALTAGDRREALPAFERAHAGFTTAGDNINAAICAMNMGVILEELDRLEEALARLSEAEAVFRSSDNHRINLAETLIASGLVRERLGDHGDALLLYRAAENEAAKAGSDGDEAAGLAGFNLAAALEAAGEFEAAIAAYETALPRLVSASQTDQAVIARQALDRLRGI